MTLHQLKVFTVVMKLRGINEAAKHLGISQPSVSLLLKSLEESLGVKLYEIIRPKKIHTTPAGAKVLQYAEDVVLNADKLKEELSEIQGLKKGKLVIGGSAIAGASFLPVAIQKFKDENPGIEVQVAIKTSASLQNKLLEGEIDVGIIGATPHSPLLISELYQEVDVVAIAPPNHPLARKRTVPLELLAKEPIISHERNNTIRRMVEKRFADLNLPFVPILEVDVHGDGRDTIKNAVASGLGIGFISKTYVVSDLKARRVELLHTPDLKLKRVINVVVHKSRQHMPLIQSFTDFMRRHRAGSSNVRPLRKRATV